MITGAEPEQRSAAGRFSFMTMTISQGRAPGLYDEQLQRQQQEKALFRGPGADKAARLLGRRRPRPEPGAEGGER